MDKCTHLNCSYPEANKKYHLCTIHNWERMHPGQDYYVEHNKKSKVYQDRMREKELKRPPKIYSFTTKAVPKPIKSISKKQAKIDSEYSKVRKHFLALNSKCQVQGCQCEATDVHHKRGRGRGYFDQWATDNSIYLTIDTRWFFASCREHHTLIEVNPEWAKEEGYSLNRLNNE